MALWWVLAVGYGKGLALHSGYNPPHLVWPKCGWFWHHNLLQFNHKTYYLSGGFVVQVWWGYHNVPRVGPHPHHTFATL